MRECIYCDRKFSLWERLIGKDELHARECEEKYEARWKKHDAEVEARLREVRRRNSMVLVPPTPPAIRMDNRGKYNCHVTTNASVVESGIGVDMTPMIAVLAAAALSDDQIVYDGQDAYGSQEEYSGGGGDFGGGGASGSWDDNSSSSASYGSSNDSSYSSSSSSDSSYSSSDSSSSYDSSSSSSSDW